MDRYRSVSPTPDLPPVRGRRAAARSATAFLLATAAAVALGGVYVGGGNPQAEGALLSLAFLSLGVGLVTCAKHLLPQQPYAEKRDQLPTTEPERAAFARDFDRADTVTRRSALVRLLTLAAGAVGAALVIPLRSLGPRPSTSALHTNWRNGARAVTSEGTLVRADDVPLDGLVTVFPEHDPGSPDGQAVLLRVRTDRLPTAPDRATWTPAGLVAFSKVCTHAGFPVGLYEPDTHTLLCPCHQSTFDVLDNAKPVTGPAAWPLPQLPLVIDADGYVASSGDFSAPIGPGWWKE